MLLTAGAVPTKYLKPRRIDFVSVYTNCEVCNCFYSYIQHSTRDPPLSLSLYFLTLMSELQFAAVLVHGEEDDEETSKVELSS